MEGFKMKFGITISDMSREQFEGMQALLVSHEQMQVFKTMVAGEEIPANIVVKATKVEKPKAEKPKKAKKAEVVEQAALDEAGEMFDGESDELGLDEPGEPEEPEYTSEHALNALKKFVAGKVKKGMSEDNAKMEAKKLLAAFQVKAVKDLTSDQIAALIKKVG